MYCTYASGTDPDLCTCLGLYHVSIYLAPKLNEEDSWMETISLGAILVPLRYSDNLKRKLAPTYYSRTRADKSKKLILTVTCTGCCRLPPKRE